MQGLGDRMKGLLIVLPNYRSDGYSADRISPTVGRRAGASFYKYQISNKDIISHRKQKGNGPTRKRELFSIGDNSSVYCKAQMRNEPLCMKTERQKVEMELLT